VDHGKCSSNSYSTKDHTEHKYSPSRGSNINDGEKRGDPGDTKNKGFGEVAHMKPSYSRIASPGVAKGVSEPTELTKFGECVSRADVFTRYDCG
jgi:hypothetical protein